MTEMTEKRLLDNYDHLEAGPVYISIVDGESIRWEYADRQADPTPLDIRYRSHDTAGQIIFEPESMYPGMLGLSYKSYFEQVGTIPLDPDCADHPALQRIAQDIERQQQERARYEAELENRKPGPPAFEK